MKEATIVKIARDKAMIDSDRDFTRQIGMSRELYINRKKNPEQYRLYELRAIFKVTGMPYRDILELVLGKEFSQKKLDAEFGKMVRM